MFSLVQLRSHTDIEAQFCIAFQATAQLEQKRKELSVHLQKMGVGLGTLGKRVVTGTTDLFDQVMHNLPT